MPQLALTRRDFMLATSFTCINLMTKAVADQTIAARTPQIHQYSGVVQINGLAPTPELSLSPGDRVTTFGQSEAILIVAQDVFHLNPNSDLVLDGELIDGNFVIRTLSLLSGAITAAFGKTGHTIVTPHTRLGIRGTGIYLEVASNSSYICTCYGTVDIVSVVDGRQRETIKATNHIARTVLATATDARYIVLAPMRDHIDADLATLERYVGRNSPF